MGAECCGDEVTATETDVGHDKEQGRWWQVRELQLAAAAAALLATGWGLGRVGSGSGVGTAGTVLEYVAAAVGAWSFVPGAVRRLLRGQIGVATLMTIAAVGAVALGKVGEAAMLGVLFSIAEGLEEYAITRTRRGLRALLDLVPRLATVLRDGVEMAVDPQQLRVDDVLVLRPGERAATDGVLRSGRTVLDLSAITGESMPVEAGPGDPVHAGAINGGGVIEVRVTAVAADSSLARIVHAVEEAQERKGAGQRLGRPDRPSTGARHHAARPRDRPCLAVCSTTRGCGIKRAFILLGPPPPRGPLPIAGPLNPSSPPNGGGPTRTGCFSLKGRPWAGGKPLLAPPPGVVPPCEQKPVTPLTP